MATNYPSTSQLKQAVKIAEKIEKLQAELDAMTGGASLENFRTSVLGSKSTSNGSEAPVKKRGGRPAGAKKAAKKGGMSAEGRARIAEAQKRRWAAARKGKK